MYELKLIGPRTLPSKVSFRKGQYFWGIVMNADANLAAYAKKDLLNTVIDIPVSNEGSFALGEALVQLPTYDKLDGFVDECIVSGLLYAAPTEALSHRDTQRKVKRHTGLTLKQIEQADRVERAIAIMNQPVSLADIAAETGFSDQAHMTRDFQRLVGYSPADIRKLFNDDTDA